MRIFMLVQRPEARGPVPRHTAYLVDALRRAGATVVTHPWGRAREGETFTEKARQRARDIASVRRALRAGTFDVVVVKTAHNWPALVRDIPLAAALRGARPPLVLQLHGSRPQELVGPGHRGMKLATRTLAALVDGVLVLSTEEERQWQSFVPSLRVRTVKNPYVRARPVGDAGAGGPPRALFVGRLHREKGIFELADALPRVLEETPFELVLVGEGPAETELRERLRQLRVEERVTFAGYREGDALRREYECATVFVLPSWSEGFPTVLAEAMDAGVPIVTTRIRGAVDHLVEGEHALFCEPRDAHGLAEALATLLRDGDLRARMSAAGRERVAIFEPDAVASEYLEALRTFVANGAGAAVRPALHQ